MLNCFRSSLFLKHKITLYGLEKAEKDTYDMSKEAMGIIKSIGHNEYLEELINMLIHRNK